MTISSTNRRAGPYSGNSSQTAFPFSFKVFEASDMLVVKVQVSTNIETTLTLTTDYTVALNADQNSNAGGTINLVTALPTGYNMVISSKVANLQETDLTNQGGFYPEVITDALDRLTIEVQQLDEGLARAAQLPITSSADAAALVADIERIASSADNLDTVAGSITNVNTVATNITNVNTVAGISGNVTTVAGIAANVTTVAGISSNVTSVAGNATNINAVAGNATNINAVNANKTNIDAAVANATNINSAVSNATNINTCATNITAIIDAPTQAANAANSAAAAAASAASGMYSAVQDKSANYTVVAGDAGDLIRVTTTSGAVTITLPLISSVSDGFKVAIVKWTNDANAVNIARSGSNTINGATSAQIGSQYSQIILVADFETNTWFASQSGLGATNVNVDVFSGAGGTAFTLTSDPSTKNNTNVFISGVYQAKATYSVSGTTLTFSTAPPTGTSNIEVYYTTPLAIGTPSDGTVVTSKIADGNVTYAKIQNVTAGKVLGRDNSGAGVVQELPIVIDAITGNAGFGTSTPASDSLIHVFSSSDKARVSVQRNGVSKAWFGQDGSGDAYIYNEASGAIRFYSGSTERAKITTGGQRQSTIIGGGGGMWDAFDCRAWVTFVGTGTVTNLGSGNVSSLSDLGTGSYRVNFTASMPDANFAAVGMNGSWVQQSAGKATGYCNISSFNSTSGAAVDTAILDVAIFR